MAGVRRPRSRAPSRYSGALLTSDETTRLLDTLCVRLGFCQPPVETQRLRELPPSDARAFTDAVFIAEGMDPELADRHLHRQVRDLVREAFRGR